MTDASLELLYRALESKPARGLLLADEQCIAEPGIQIPVITNRVDVAQRFQAAGFNAALSDFDLSVIDVDSIYYRVSKEKALVHHLINQALLRLPIGGELVLTGEKGDGLKTYADKARTLVGSDKDLNKGRGGALLARIRKQREPETSLDDSNYRQLCDIAPQGHVALYSKPGVYGWQKIDRGSRLLIGALGDVLDKNGAQAPRDVLDLGCGYGYLTVMAHQRLPDARFVATDNNVTALVACTKNIETHAISAQVVPADCADGIGQQFDLVLCNPPFHKGFDIHGDLTLAFLKAAAARLAPDGMALFVVNQFIALEQKAEPLFASCERAGEGEGFKVYLLKR